jgi:hypothetical protein
MKLTNFEVWMVEQQLQWVKVRGITRVLEDLEAQGYIRVANEVRRRYNRGEN